MENQALNNVSSLVTSFVSDFFSNPENAENTEKWVSDKIKSSLADITEDEASKYGKCIVDTVNKINANIQSIDTAIENGGSRESWLCDAANNALKDKSIGTKAKILTSCITSINSVVEEFGHEGQFKVNGELKDVSEMWEDSNWNEYKIDELAKNVAQQAGIVAIKTLSENIISDINESIQNSTELDNDQLCAAVGSAADIGVKTAAAGALQVAYKKGMLKKVLPFEVEPQVLTDIAVGAVENVKIIISAANEGLSAEEAIDRVQRHTIARVVNFIAEKGEAVGTSIGAAFGPHGAVIGKFIGKALSYCAKTDVKEKMIEAGNSICNCARACAKTLAKAAVSTFESIKNAIFA